MINAFEIDFLPVGSNSKSGDAIAMRFGYYEGSWKSQTVFVIDGGNIESGEKLITHVNEIYKTDKVDRAILTHPDKDHASGLRKVVQELNIGKIWMHRPWHYWTDIKDSIKDGRITKKSFSQKLQEAYQFAYEIEETALSRGIEIYPPHQGNSYRVSNQDVIKILGPGKDFYLSLIQSSNKTPQMELSEAIAKALSENQKKVKYETMSFETENLAIDDEATSAENDMSLILYLTIADKKILLTGDAGTMGLYKAIAYASRNNIKLNNLDLLQIPHHGSRHNLSKGILKHIWAPQAVISSAINGEPSHPAKIVTNALHRRNINPFCTKGILLNYRGGIAPLRYGMNSANPFPFHYAVEVAQ